MKKNDPQAYCCSRFKESATKEKICRSPQLDENIDETEWYLPEWLHIYYCPFCGKLVKGKGYGEFHLKKSCGIIQENKTFCCVRLKEGIREGFLILSLTSNEKEIDLSVWLNVFYCPFCGKCLMSNKKTRFYLKCGSGEAETS